MQHIVNSNAGAPAGAEIGDVGLKQREAFPRVETDNLSDVVEVLLAAGREIIQTDDFLVKLQERFDKTRADESGCACDKPGVGFSPQLLKDFPVAHSYLTPVIAAEVVGS